MDLYENNNSCHLVMLEWFSIQILVSFEIFKLSSNLSLMHLRAQSACYELNQQKVMTFFKSELFSCLPKRPILSTILYKEMYGISQENLYGDTGSLRHNVLGLVDTFLVIINKSRIT